jgi:hypothetical protein
MVAFVSLFVSRATEKGAKTVQSGPFQKVDLKRESLGFQVFPFEAKLLMKILSLARLPIPPHRLAKGGEEYQGGIALRKPGFPRPACNRKQKRLGISSKPFAGHNLTGSWQSSDQGRMWVEVTCRHCGLTLMFNTV